MRKTCQSFTQINVNDCAVGVDGCRGGWLALALESRGGHYAFEVFPSWESLTQKLTTSRIIAVDMPIGLAQSGRRPCDQLARQKLGRARASSIFAPPRRPMLNFDTYDDANRWGKQARDQGDDGGGLAKQAWNLLPKIREIDDVIGPHDQDHIIEAHPELAFQHLNGGTCPERKKTPTGQRQRRALLAREGLSDLDTVVAALDPKDAAADDVLDAGALALVAARKAAGQAHCLSGDPRHDARGLRMEIWY